MTKLWYEKLQFCGCGIPDKVQVFLAQTLKQATVRNDELKGEDSFAFYEERNRLVEDLIKSHTAELKYLVYYIFDAMKLTEHGGSVPGWLSGEGEKYIKDVEEGCIYEGDEDVGT